MLELAYIHGTVSHYIIELFSEVDWNPDIFGSYPEELYKTTQMLHIRKCKNAMLGCEDYVYNAQKRTL